MKKNSTSLLFLLCLLSVGLLSKLYGQTPATLPYGQNFSTGNDLTLLNTGQTNQWFYGSVTGNPGGSLYISNDNGVSNSYSITAESVVQAYRDITIPAGTTSASFSFDWKGFGESTYDYLRVWLVPATFTPTPGVQIAAGAGRIQVGQFNQQNSWQSYSSPAMNISTFAGGPMRLVFEWRNDDIRSHLVLQARIELANDDGVHLVGAGVIAIGEGEGVVGRGRYGNLLVDTVRAGVGVVRNREALKTSTCGSIGFRLDGICRAVDFRG